MRNAVNVTSTTWNETTIVNYLLFIRLWLDTIIFVLFRQEEIERFHGLSKAVLRHQTSLYRRT